MKPVWLAAALAFGVFLMLSPSADAASGRSPCLGGLTSTLTGVEFSGSVDCAKDELSVRQVGAIQSKAGLLVIYDYRYRLAPACASCARRGGQRVIFVRDGLYIGQYKPNAVRVAIVGTDLVLTPENKLGKPVRVSLADATLPRKILVSGEVLEFFR